MVPPNIQPIHTLDLPVPVQLSVVMLHKSTEAGSEGHNGVTMCKLNEAVHPSPGHSVPVSHSKMHVEAMSHQSRKGYNYQKLSQEMEGSFAPWEVWIC